MTLYFQVLTGLTYLGLATFLVGRLKHPEKQVPEWGKWLPFIPAASHLFVVYLLIERSTPDGQNLSLLNLVSLVTLILVLLVAVYRFNRQTPHLMLYTAIIAGIANLLTLIPEEPNIINFDDNVLSIIHVWLAVIGFSLFLAATLQSILVLILHDKLRHKPGSIHPLLPPLLEMEHFLSALVLSGIISLGIAFALVFGIPETVIESQPLHKIILSVLAWFSFCTFYIGYKTSKLSGIRFARLCIIAFVVLSLGFIGTKLVTQFIL
ncbi:cytochrome c biogenesis protein CcsA [Kangiella sediminilitoris]|uniref:Cytochrome c assembly protein n=1 Tax=Kangiella sediminilitoris TaxID=1144748 RepID=A0A1B3BBX3_9GAMM|nr:cytochrome c biogenesis protein CcsA [Kangiella sediminilitoris]AOE50267.1 Cytochrome c assembly protein [Kangiella sediminilitoris]